MITIPLPSTEQEDSFEPRAGRPDRNMTAKPYEDHGSSRRSVGVRRSGPRSRAGCVTCKQRRVRCDECHPICGHCSRLQLRCYYQPHTKRSRASGTGSRSDGIPDATIRSIDPLECQKGSAGSGGDLNWLMPSHLQSANNDPNSMDPSNVEPWSYVMNFNCPDLVDDVSTSWAIEFPCLFPEDSYAPGSNSSTERNDTDSSVPRVMPGGATNTSAEVPSATHDMSTTSMPVLHDPLSSGLSVSPQAHDQFLFAEDGCSEPNAPSTQLIRRFLRIVQPPAAILISASRRWRRLQGYLCRVSEQNRAVHNALLCVVGLLTVDETHEERAGGREEWLTRLHDHHQRACDDIRATLSSTLEPGAKTTEYLLAAIFLLAWFEVIRDQDDKNCPFPRNLAHSVISSKTNWSRVSQELLAWMNTLDNKAAHLGGDHLLSQQTIVFVSHHQTQITSSDPFQDDDGSEPVRGPSAASDGTPADLSGGEFSKIECSRAQKLDVNCPITQKGQVKQAVLNAILQPALQWYLTSQSYCRRISAHDMYHRRRSNTDDEYEIITACKQLESELSDLWKSRPSVISLTAEQLTEVVPADFAARLEEIFSVYLGSFWTLFVYLHRVSWWNMPHPPAHSDLVRRALAETWRCLRRAYGEVVEGTTKKIIHPSLMWPVFLFGCECVDLDQRNWAIQQLEDLGDAKPALEVEELEEEDRLLPFRMSSGATRNAKRAAILLTKLTEEQDRKKCKIDARELSIRLFGCHFSLV